ncbi:glycogen synthase GlgA [Labrys okinawensis]|uniref:glycogen synthase GlgA n=1 Tax=Labrys okinawensis TaxID=346911 RepID=UPI0039BD90EA
MEVLSAASEFFPLSKTGGLGDVVGALPKVLAPLGISTTTLIPAYPGLVEKLSAVSKIAELELLGEKADLLAGSFEDIPILLLDCASLFARPGGPYLNEQGVDHPDNWKRFGALSLAAAYIAAGKGGPWRPDLVHLHDWQTGLAAAYMAALGVKIPIVTTIHNLAFQGQFSADIFTRLGLPASYFSTEYLEYYGDISYLKSGIVLSDAITTVSPTYAREILTDDMGMGLQGVLSERRERLQGIVNGIDTDVWDPAKDPLIPARYDRRSLKRRDINKSEIVERFGLVDDGGPIMSVISRLTWQKGIDILTAVVPGIVDRGAKLVVFGQGDPSLINPLIDLASKYQGRVAVFAGFSEAHAHLLHAGSDIVVQPSRFEPCGLTQLYALRYGAIPIVSRTGGLAETIIDANEAAMAAGVATGFQFNPGSAEDLYHAVDRALRSYEQPDFWRKLQSHAMKADFSWKRSARQYAKIYSRVLRSGPS